jgi:hypothetical protein
MHTVHISYPGFKILLGRRHQSGPDEPASSRIFEDLGERWQRVGLVHPVYNTRARGKNTEFRHCLASGARGAD